MAEEIKKEDVPQQQYTVSDFIQRHIKKNEEDKPVLNLVDALAELHARIITQAQQMKEMQEALLGAVIMIKELNNRIIKLEPTGIKVVSESEAKSIIKDNV